jgi:hypothetical protein
VIMREIGGMAVSLLGLEEVDRLDTFKEALAPNLRLAAFKVGH